MTTTRYVIFYTLNKTNYCYRMCNTEVILRECFYQINRDKAAEITEVWSSSGSLNLEELDSGNIKYKKFEESHRLSK